MIIYICIEELVSNLKVEFTEIKTQTQFNECCTDIRDISPAIAKITQKIEDLANSIPDTLVLDAKGMEQALKDKCAQIKL